MAKKRKYLVTMYHEASIRIQTVSYPSIKAAEEDAKKHGWVIQAVHRVKDEGE